MLAQVVQHKQLPFHAVLMDTWYATKDLRLFIDSLHKIYDCPLKDHRQVDDSGDQERYRRVDELAWTNHAWAHGKRIKIKGFPNDDKVKLFRVAVATCRTDWVVTNDLAQDSDHAVNVAIKSKTFVTPSALASPDGIREGPLQLKSPASHMTA